MQSYTNTAKMCKWTEQVPCLDLKFRLPCTKTWTSRPPVSIRQTTVQIRNETRWWPPVEMISDVCARSSCRAYSHSIVWIFTTVAQHVCRVMAPEEEPARNDESWPSVTHRPHLNSTAAHKISATRWFHVFSYFLLMSVRVTPFRDTFMLTMVGVKEPGAFSSVEDTALCTAQGPVSISVGMALR